MPEILRKPIFKAGKTYDGRLISKKQVKEAYENTVAMLDDGYKIPVKLGHEDFNQISKGWLMNLVLDDDTIFADFVDLDMEIYQSFQSGKLPSVSIELRNKVYWKDEKYSNVISAVAMLGIDQPAIQFKSEVSTWFKYHENINEGVNMPEEKSEKFVIEQFEAQKKEIESYKAKIENFEAVIQEKDTLISEQENQIEIFKAKVQEQEKKEFETRKTSLIEKFESEVIAKNRLQPSEKDKVLQTFEALNYDVEKCENIISTYASLPEGVLTKEFASTTESDVQLNKFDKAFGVTEDDKKKYRG